MNLIKVELQSSCRCHTCHNIMFNAMLYVISLPIVTLIRAGLASAYAGLSVRLLAQLFQLFALDSGLPAEASRLASTLLQHCTAPRLDDNWWLISSTVSPAYPGISWTNT